MSTNRKSRPAPARHVQVNKTQGATPRSPAPFAETITAVQGESTANLDELQITLEEIAQLNDELDLRLASVLVPQFDGKSDGSVSPDCITPLGIRIQQMVRFAQAIKSHYASTINRISI